MQHIAPKGKVERYFNDLAGDRLRTEVKQVQARKVAGGEDNDLTTWTREGTYQGVHYVFDRAGDLVSKGDPHGGSDDLIFIWGANHRLAESRRNGQSTYYGYDPLGRRVFKRNPTQTTWFFWGGDALLGEVQQANDAEEAAPVWVGNVASLVEVKRRQRRLERLHERIREYVYFPGTFVPLALVDKCQGEAAKDVFSATAAVDSVDTQLVRESSSGPSASLTIRDASGEPAQIRGASGAPATAADRGKRGLGVLGAPIGLGQAPPNVAASAIRSSLILPSVVEAEESKTVSVERLAELSRLGGRLGSY